MQSSTTERTRIPLLSAALSFAGLNIVTAIIGAPGPRPDTAASTVSDYVVAHTDRATVLGVLVLLTALPLAVWTSIAYRRIQTVHVTAPGPVIGLAGGLLASASLAVCGLVSWTMANTADLADPAISKVLSTLAFAFGGPGFVAMFGLLLAGVSVSGLSMALMPRPVAWAGLVLAAFSVFSIVSLLASVLYPLLPVGRFGGAIWLIVVATLVQKDRQYHSTVNEGVAS